MKLGVALLSALAALGAPLSADDRAFIDVNPTAYERVRAACSGPRYRSALKRVRRRARMARKLRRGWA